MQAEKTHLKITKYNHIIGIFGTQSNIYDGVFSENQSTVFSR